MGLIFNQLQKLDINQIKLLVLQSSELLSPTQITQKPTYQISLSMQTPSHRMQRIPNPFQTQQSSYENLLAQFGSNQSFRKRDKYHQKKFTNLFQFNDRSRVECTDSEFMEQSNQDGNSFRYNHNGFQNNNQNNNERNSKIFKPHNQYQTQLSSYQPIKTLNKIQTQNKQNKTLKEPNTYQPNHIYKQKPKLNQKQYVENPCHPIALPWQSPQKSLYGSTLNQSPYKQVTFKPSLLFSIKSNQGKEQSFQCQEYQSILKENLFLPKQDVSFVKNRLGKSVDVQDATHSYKQTVLQQLKMPQYFQDSLANINYQFNQNQQPYKHYRGKNQQSHKNNHIKTNQQHHDNYKINKNYQIKIIPSAQKHQNIYLAQSKLIQSQHLIKQIPNIPNSNKQQAIDKNNKRKRKKIFDFNKNQNHNQISQSVTHDNRNHNEKNYNDYTSYKDQFTSKNKCLMKSLQIIDKMATSKLQSEILNQQNIIYSKRKPTKQHKIKPQCQQFCKNEKMHQQLFFINFKLTNIISTFSIQQFCKQKSSKQLKQLDLIIVELFQYLQKDNLDRNQQYGEELITLKVLVNKMIGWQQKYKQVKMVLAKLEQEIKDVLLIPEKHKYKKVKILSQVLQILTKTQTYFQYDIKNTKNIEYTQPTKISVNITKNSKLLSNCQLSTCKIPLFILKFIKKQRQQLQQLQDWLKQCFTNQKQAQSTNAKNPKYK